MKNLKNKHKSIHRSLVPPKDSFFLFGPRATGKSTWLNQNLKADFFIDLLKSKDFLRFSQHPEDLSDLVKGNPKWKCIVIDEIQKVPHLLDEIHSLIFSSHNKLQFILTGSSARKLKREHANLLAGRALVRKFHPITGYELATNLNINELLEFGMLPRIFGLKTIDEKKDYLYSYVETYLKEEIQQEALTRNLPAYSKFLEHLALRNSQVLNLQNLSSQIGVARTTLKGYLEILEDTLIGQTLQPLHLQAKVKEVSTPKFYFFDTGVVRALSQTLDDPLDSISKGSQLETYILHELVSYSDYFQKRWNFYYWGTPSDSEVDFIISHGKTNFGIEVKSSVKWKDEFNKGLNILIDAGKIKKGFGVYLGNEIIQKDRIVVIPAKQFSQILTENKFFV
jgi:predicted AAA+ superfamily ATPase